MLHDKSNNANSNTGGPLIADSNSDTDNNKKDGDNGNSDTDIVSYLVGVVSFGPRVWFVPLVIYHFNSSYNIISILLSFHFHSSVVRADIQVMKL